MPRYLAFTKMRKSFITILSSSTALKVIDFLYAFILIYMLVPADYGTQRLVIGTATLLYTIFSLNYHEGITHYCLSSKSDEELGKTLYSGIIPRLILAIMTSTILWTLAGEISNFYGLNITKFIQIFALYPLLMTIAQTDVIFLKYRLFTLKAATDISTRVVKVTAGIILVHYGWKVMGVVVGLAISWGFYTGISLLVFMYYGRNWKLSINTETMKLMLDYSLPLWVAGIFSFLFTQGNVLL
ncbi:MAG: oligosaccharide flippase family protein, partial [Candidatus Hodarchaeota archaeon]